jgi:hypothetical protein
MNQANIFVEALQNAGYEPRSYSGRGMYGKQCVAVVTDDNAFKVGVLVMAELPEEFDTYLLESVEDDSMGLSTVIYWPDVKWINTEDSEEQ